MLISHQFLYLGVCLLAVYKTVVCLNITNNSPLIIPPTPHHQLYQQIDQQQQQQQESVNNNNYINNNNNNYNNHQANHLDYDPNLFELVDEESTLTNSQVPEDQLYSNNENININNNNNNNYDDQLGDRSAPDTSATVWSRLSGNVVRVFSPARLSNRLNQG